MTMTGARFFQFYLDNYFKFPKEIKNDIIYCQRALKAHIKVHQLVVEKLKPEESRKRVLEELESEILEINAEQHYLLLRLRRVIDEFYKSLQRGGMAIDAMVTNQLISKEVVPYIEDESLQILPVSVLFRNTEEKLVEKYFANENEKTPYEIFDSKKDIFILNDQKRNTILHSDVQQQQQQHQIQQSQIKIYCNAAENNNASNSQTAFSRIVNPNHLLQVSLLKPISQRMVGGPAGTKFGVRALYAEPTNNNINVNIATYTRATPYELPPPRNLPIVLKDETIQDETMQELPVSKNVTLSRLNLRQALKKAKTETLAAAKATANIITKPPAPPIAPVESGAVSRPVTAPPQSSSVGSAANKNKTDTKLKAMKSVAIANVKNAVITECTSSSEDSNGERSLTPPHVLCTREKEENKTQPEDYGQEMFLRLFGLFTPEMHVQMQQRRSKRRRRTVYNNERADFHYGRFENTSAQSDDKKRRRAFLLSPQLKRGLQTRRSKRTVMDKNSDSAASRSSSSSPDEKRACNECLKGGGSIDKCEECKGFYHQTCHAEETKVELKRTLPIDHIKHCPACSRAQLKLLNNEAKQYETLKSTVQELEQKMAKEKHRRASLQHRSKMHKIQMRNLFNIVRTIKSDNENDSSD